MIKRKGVSTFISVLILMLLAIAGGTMIYGYTIGALGNLVETPSQGIIALDTVKIDASTHLLTAYIRNSGREDVRVDNIYIDDTIVPGANMTVSLTPISEGEIATVTVTWWQFTSDHSYNVIIVSDDGSKLTFNEIAE